MRAYGHTTRSDKRATIDFRGEPGSPSAKTGACEVNRILIEWSLVKRQVRFMMKPFSVVLLACLIAFGSVAQAATTVFNVKVENRSKSTVYIVIGSENSQTGQQTWTGVATVGPGKSHTHAMVAKGL